MILQNLCKAFGENKVIENLSLTLEEGRCYVLMAPSGKGKTTLLKLIAGLLPADAGTIEKKEKKIAFVFQEDRLCEDFRGWTNVRMVSTLPDKELEKHFEELGLLEVKEKPVKEYSGGMKRRIAIARAVAFEPDLLLLDEPFKGLDTQRKIQVMDYIQKHCPKTTILLASHDLFDAEYFHGEIVMR